MTEVKSQDDIEMNDDGKTAYCDGCEKNDCPAGPEEITSWTTGILYHATRTDPAEYGQFCPKCSAQADEQTERTYEDEKLAEMFPEEN